MKIKREGINTSIRNQTTDPADTERIKKECQEQLDTHKFENLEEKYQLLQTTRYLGWLILCINLAVECLDK